MTVATDPRLRARKVAVARQAGHRRLVVLSGVLVVVALVVSALVALHSSLLSARVVHLRGALHESRAELLAVTGLAAHPPLIDVSPAADEAAIDKLPWVASCQVVRDWPTGVTIQIRERHPVAYVALSGTQAALVDATGRVLASGLAPRSGLVRLQHNGPVGLPGTSLTAARPVLALVARLPAGLRSRLAFVAARPGQGIVAQLVKGPLVVFGSPGATPAKVGALETVLARVSLHGIVTIDLRVPAQPVLTR